MTQVYSGVFPVVPTIFDASGALDLDGQKRALDFLVDSGVAGVCILANWSEQFALTDDERELLTRLTLKHVDGRVPVIVTTSHFSTRVAVERSQRAEAQGASMIMLMPPYHGTTLRADEPQVYEFLRAVNDAVSVPIMIQDAPMSGVTLSVPFLARLAAELSHVQYIKVEVPAAAAKLRALIAAAGASLPGPFDGEEAVTLLPDLDAGATGTMPGATVPDLLVPILTAYRDGRRAEAQSAYHRVLPMLHYENRQCGIRAAKALMHAGGIIASDMVRHPTLPLPEPTRSGLIDLARTIDPLVLRWARD